MQVDGFTSSVYQDEVNISPVNKQEPSQQTVSDIHQPVGEMSFQ